MENTQKSLNKQNTRREVANQYETIRMDEPTRSVRKHTTDPDFVNCKRKDRNR